LWNNEVVRESTKQRNANTARTIESAPRTALANGLVGIREKTPSPSLAEFFKNDFVPCVETKHAAKPETAEYYTDGASMVMQVRAGSQPLDKISDQHAQHFAASAQDSRCRSGDSQRDAGTRTEDARVKIPPA
jgi:hypothetical protein